MPRVAWLLLGAGLLWAGCRRGGRSAGPAVRDSAGVTIVENAGVDHPVPWHLSTVASFGGADTGVLNLGTLNYGTVGSDTLGRTFVASESELYIASFDSTGRLIQVISRRGAGPGELKVLGSMYVAPNGRLTVQDYGRIKLVQFDEEGRPAGDLPLLPLVGRLYGAIRYSGDTLYLHGQVDTVRQAPEHLFLVTARDTLPMVTMPQAPPNGTLNACNRYHMPGLPRIFAPLLNWTTGGGRVVVNSTAAYQVDVFQAGRVVRRIRRAVPLVPANTAMIRRLYPRGRMYGGSECIVPVDQIEREIGAADVVPTIRDVAIDRSGRIWVGRYTFPDEPPRTDVLSADGAYLGTVIGMSAPLGFPRPELVVTASVDSATDVSRLVISRIRPR